MDSYLSSCFQASLLDNKKTVTFSDSKGVTCSYEDADMIIVKFQINKQTFATAFKGSATIATLKKCLAYALEEDDNSIILQTDDGRVPELEETLKEIGASSNLKITLLASSTNGHMGNRIIEIKVESNIPTLDVITVHAGDPDDCRDIVVEIENQCCNKEWLGGYRHKSTNIEYHNANTQTGPKPRKTHYINKETGDTVPLLYNRDTQTPFKPKDACIDTKVDKATQMWRLDLFIDPKTDKIVIPKECELHGSIYDRQVAAAVVIQRAVRNWIFSCKLKKIVEFETAILSDIKRHKKIIGLEQAKKDRAIKIGTTYPVNRDDFYRLYLIVSIWWKREWARINALRSGESKKAEAEALLTKEVQLLGSIERHRIVVKEEALKKEKVRFLDQCSRPYIFKNGKGHLVSIDDVHTQRAKEFKEIYVALSRNDMSSQDRIDVLITLKNMFVAHYMEYEYANDLVSLISREIDMLSIGMKIADVKALHQRIALLYMNFMEQKQFNPKGAKYKRYNTPKTIHEEFLCRRCLKLLPVTKFPVHVRMKAYTECTSCTWLQNIGGQRVDMSPYLRLLKAVQNSEMEKCCHSAVCFIFQTIGMGHLTKVIWHGHSAISECSDLTKLRHIRWLSHIEWAPWNTILLTDQEAKYHVSIPNVFDFYDKSFIEMVRQRHILARLTFIDLLMMSFDIQESGVWGSITDSGPFLHPSHATEFAVQGYDYDNEGF